MKEMPNNTKGQAENKIGDEGTRALSEALKANTTLTALNLHGDQQQDTAAQQGHQTVMSKDNTGNEIGVEGARALSEALKVNTTLETLDLASVQQQDNAIK